MKHIFQPHQNRLEKIGNTIILAYLLVMLVKILLWLSSSLFHTEFPKADRILSSMKDYSGWVLFTGMLLINFGKRKRLTGSFRLPAGSIVGAALMFGGVLLWSVFDYLELTTNYYIIPGIFLILGLCTMAYYYQPLEESEHAEQPESHPGVR